METLLNSTFFTLNRQKLTSSLENNSVAFLSSNKILDNFPYKYIQDKNLFYLTGIEQEGTLLIVYPNEEEILFLKNSDINPVWSGDRLSKEQAQKISGIKNIKFYNDIHQLRIKSLLSKNVYTNIGNSHLSEVDVKDIDFVLNKINIDELMNKIRIKKEDCEIECIKQACNITKQGFDEVIKSIKPGIKEYEIEGILLGSYIRNSSRYPSFNTIVASGKNACTLHYTDNNCICHDESLVSIDTGSEYFNYCSDITRAFPINGRFLKRQKDIYNSVLNISKFAKSILTIGMTFKELQQAVVEKTKEELSILGLLNKEELAGDGYKKYFMHNVSHSLGLDVHDLCNRDIPFMENMVITIEPGIYVSEENIGIRLEDDVVIKKEGCEILSKEIPIEMEEIEAKMR